MSKIARTTQTIFASSAVSGQLKVFGSLANGTPTTATGPGTGVGGIQNLSTFLTGWFSAVLGINAPAIEDMNSLFYLAFYQLAYAFQAGIAEWDSATTYYKGSVVQSSGVIYVSLTDTNAGNAVTSAGNWRNIEGAVQLQTVNYSVIAGDKFIRLNCTTAGTSLTATLPDATLNLGASFEIKKDSADASGHNVLVATVSAQTVDGTSSPYTIVQPGQFVVVRSNGTNYEIVGAG